MKKPRKQGQNALAMRKTRVKQRFCKLLHPAKVAKSKGTSGDY
jgi:hypothetical protein